jgi:Nitrous oxide-stimulated promoter
MSISIQAPPPQPPSARLQEKAIQRDILVLARFVELYCRAHHGAKEIRSVTAHGTLAPWINGLGTSLCPECTCLFLHGAAKRVLCSYNPKPRCKICPTPCYRQGYRAAIKAVMHYGGRRMIFRGRLDLLYEYLF